MGLILVIIAEFFWALELVLVKKYFPTQNPFSITAASSIIAALLYTPVFIYSRPHFTQKEWIVLGALALTSLFLAQFFYVTGIQKSSSAILTTLATLTMPLFALAMSVLFLKEQFTPRAAIGTLFMFVGFIIVSF